MPQKDIVTDAARSGVKILQTPREVSQTVRDGFVPRDINAAIATARLTLRRPNFISTSESPTQTGTKYIVSPRRSIIPQEVKNAEPLDTSFNRFRDEHGHPTPIFSKVIGPKTVPDESADIYARKRVDFGSNSVVAKSPNFLDLDLSPANTMDKLMSVIGPTTIV